MEYLHFNLPQTGSAEDCSDSRQYLSLREEVSVSPTFYEQLFHTKVFFAASLVLTFCVCNLLAKRNRQKAVRKILVKLTTGGFRRSQNLWKEDEPKETPFSLSIQQTNSHLRFVFVAKR